MCCVVTKVHVLPPAESDAAYDVISPVTGRLQRGHPHALHLPSRFSVHSSAHIQYVPCYSRDNDTLDLFDSNTTEAYNSSPPPLQGTSDCTLMPAYKAPLWSRHTDCVKVVQWDYFDTTVWEVLCDAHWEHSGTHSDCAVARLEDSIINGFMPITESDYS